MNDACYPANYFEPIENDGPWNEDCKKCTECDEWYDPNESRIEDTEGYCEECFCKMEGIE